jgi:hypothetical protein
MAKEANNGKRTAGKPTLRQDPLVDRLRSDPSQPPAIAWQGFLGRSEKEGYWRLYLSRALTDYLEIAESDIVLQESLATERDPDAGSRIWIKETAVITRGPVQARALVPGSLSPDRWRCIQPRTGLAGPLMVASLLPWAMAAHGWIAFCSALEQQLFRADRQDMHCGNVISLRRCDYKVLL